MVKISKITEFELVDEIKNDTFQDFGVLKKSEQTAGLIDWLQGYWIDVRRPSFSYYVCGKKVSKYQQGDWQKDYDLTKGHGKMEGALFWGFKRTHKLAGSIGENVALWANKKNEIIWKWMRAGPMFTPPSELCFEMAKNTQIITPCPSPTTSCAPTVAPVDSEGYSSGFSSDEEETCVANFMRLENEFDAQGESLVTDLLNDCCDDDQYYENINISTSSNQASGEFSPWCGGGNVWSYAVTLEPSYLEEIYN